jgi:hypothetical protein
VAALATSYLKRQKFLARLQAVEIMNAYAEMHSERNTVSPDAMLEEMGVTL